jgi:uncharacterized protein YdeI (YjbR/CyaY-like superfamily)
MISGVDGPILRGHQTLVAGASSKEKRIAEAKRRSVHLKSAKELRLWLARHHSTERELVVRLRKAATSEPGLTYAEALDQALCFGWIDGVRWPYDGGWYLARFSPRKPDSIWSNVNLRHYRRLEAAGLVLEPGRAAFARRNPARTGVYSFETRPRALPRELERTFRSESAAWKFFNAQPPGYRRIARFWVASAKKPETRERRLSRLIADSKAGRRLGIIA